MGFHRTALLLKRAARFFFYCRNIVQVFISVLRMFIMLWILGYVNAVLSPNRFILQSI